MILVANVRELMVFCFLILFYFLRDHIVFFLGIPTMKQGLDYLLYVDVSPTKVL